MSLNINQYRSEVYLPSRVDVLTRQTGEAAYGDATGGLSDAKSAVDSASDAFDEAVSGNWGGIIINVLNIFGVDVEGWLTELTGGDFDDMSKRCTAIQQAGAFLGTHARDLAELSPTLGDTWTGEAAELGRHYLEELADAADEIGFAMAAIGPVAQVVVDQLEEAVKKLAEAITKALERLITKAIDYLAGLGKFRLAFTLVTGGNIMDHFRDLEQAWNALKISWDEVRSTVEHGKEQWDSWSKTIKEYDETLKALARSFDAAGAMLS